MKTASVLKYCLHLRPVPFSAVRYCSQQTKQTDNNGVNAASSSDSDSSSDSMTDVQKFVESLTPEHRSEILIEIQKIESAELKQRAEGG